MNNQAGEKVATFHSFTSTIDLLDKFFLPYDELTV